MAEKQTFLPAVWSEVWKQSYASLSGDRQRLCDQAVMALIKRESSSGLRVKPIQPEKYYLEARINNGDRIVFRFEGGSILFIDIVKHDDIGRYGRKPKRVTP